MDDKLKDNQEALEALFEDEFYIVEPRSVQIGKQKNADLSEEGDPTNVSPEQISNVKPKHMSKPCMVFKAGENPGQQRNFLDLWRKILAAVQLSPNAVNTVELEPGIEVMNILEGNMGKPVIFWTGEDSAEDLAGFAAYEIHANEDMTFVISDPLHVIANNKELKVKLWSVLQQINFSPDE